jgi:hypothetical protein
MLFEDEVSDQISVKTGNTRVTGKEQYYTPLAQARKILSRVLQSVEFDPSIKFLEPAGGTGAFVMAALEAGFTAIETFDIEPKHELVKEADFLKTDLVLQNAVCVTNPPFGRNNSLSIPFFNKAAEYSDYIAFVVPRSWRKWSVLNRLDPNFKLVDDWDLSIDYVDDLNEETHGVGNLRTCVQVWKRVPGYSREVVKVRDFNIIEKTTPEQADVSFTLFGYGCGTVKTEFERKKNSTQAFFKLNHPRALEALQSVDFSQFYNHTAYTEALGLQEINFLLNDFLGFENNKYSLDPLNENYLGLHYVVENNVFGD